MVSLVRNLGMVYLGASDPPSLIGYSQGVLWGFSCCKSWLGGSTSQSPMWLLAALSSKLTDGQGHHLVAQVSPQDWLLTARELAFYRLGLRRRWTKWDRQRQIKKINKDRNTEREEGSGAERERQRREREGRGQREKICSVFAT